MIDGPPSTPSKLDAAIDGRWGSRRDFTAKRITTSRKRDPREVVSVANSDATLPQYLGGNFVWFGPKP